MHKKNQSMYHFLLVYENLTQFKHHCLIKYNILGVSYVTIELKLSEEYIMSAFTVFTLLKVMIVGFTSIFMVICIKK